MTRQYCGQLDKQDNCQVAVSLSLANHDASLPITYRLYLPEDWANDRARRHKAKVPETITFQTKPQIALDQIKAARAAGLRVATATAPNCAPGSPLSACPMWRVSAPTRRSGTGPLPAPPGRGIGRPPKLLRRDEQHQPISVKVLALSPPTEAWRTVARRDGTADWLSSCFARQRVRPTHRGTELSQTRAEEWLLTEWPDEEAEPTKYWFATLPEDIALDRLVDLAKLRWRIERLSRAQAGTRPW